MAYECLWAVADSLLGQGMSVVLDSPCRFENIVRRGTALAVRHDAAYGFIECVLADGAELACRMLARPRRRSQQADPGRPAPDVLARQVREHGAAVLATRYPESPWLRLDTGVALEQCLVAALAYLDGLLSRAVSSAGTSPTT